MERGEDEVARERRLDRRVGRLQIPDLADHDDVGVAPEEGAEGAVERQADLAMNLHLPDAGLRDLDRVLGRPHLDARPLHVREGGVERRRFPGARRADAERDPVGLLDDLAQPLERLRFHPDLIEGEHLVFREQPEHHILESVGCGHDRHAEIGLAASLVLEPDLPVLREPVLRDVELGHDLDPRDDGARARFLDLEVVVADAVDAEPDGEPASGGGLEVDVRRAPIGRGLDRVVHEADRLRIDLGALAARKIVSRFRRGQPFPFGILRRGDGNVGRRGLGRRRGGTQELFERLEEVLADGHSERELLGAGLAGDVVDERQVVRVDDHDLRPVALPSHGEDGVGPEELRRELPQEVRSDRPIRGGGREGALEVLGEAPSQRDLVDAVVGQEDLLEGTVLPHGLLAGLSQSFARDEPALEKIVVRSRADRALKDLLQAAADVEDEVIEDLEPLLVHDGVLRAVGQLDDAREVSGAQDGNGDDVPLHAFGVALPGERLLPRHRRVAHDARRIGGHAQLAQALPLEEPRVELFRQRVAEEEAHAAGAEEIRDVLRDFLGELLEGRGLERGDDPLASRLELGSRDRQSRLRPHIPSPKKFPVGVRTQAQMSELGSRANPLKGVYRRTARNQGGLRSNPSATHLLPGDVSPRIRRTSERARGAPPPPAASGIAPCTRCRLSPEGAWRDDPPLHGSRADASAGRIPEARPRVGPRRRVPLGGTS